MCMPATYSLRHTYQCKLWLPHPDNTTTKQDYNSRFWPEIVQTNTDESFGACILVKPGKMDAFLKKNKDTHVWTQQIFPIAKQALAGPFNFDLHNTVPNLVWDRFRTKAAELNYDSTSAFKQTRPQAILARPIPYVCV
eukprot:scaffold119359_cov36-Attheya_sp.AAC.1